VSPTSPASAPAGLLARQAEFAAAVLATLMALAFHWINLHHVGALWRDEAAYVQIANLPTWSDVCRMLTHDHSPILVPAVIRTWCAAGFGNTDFGLRLLGFGIGLLLTASFWFASWTTRRGFPLLPLALVAVNALATRYGDALRGYGLGCVLCVLMVVLIGRATQKMSPLNVALAALAAVLSVQALYQNSVFVLAACCGGMGVCAAGRRWRDAGWILAVGLIAALSLVPYIGTLAESQDWWIISKAGFLGARCWRYFSIAAAFPFPVVVWVWLFFCLCALVAAVWSVRAAASVTRNRVLFHAVALVIGIAGYVLFIKMSGLPTQPWYYLLLLCFMAVCLDAILPDVRAWVSPVLAGFALLAAVAGWFYGINLLEARQTNMDLVAARLKAEAGPEDCILVHPWYAGISFSRYYHGSTPWMTLPPLKDYRFYRYDLLKVKLQEEQPIQPVLDRLEKTLRSGHRVWVVGDLDPSRNPLRPPKPAPNNPWGWNDSPYISIWGAQTGWFLLTHARQLDQLPALTLDYVDSNECEPIIVVAGWKEPSSIEAQ